MNIIKLKLIACVTLAGMFCACASGKPSLKAGTGSEVVVAEGMAPVVNEDLAGAQAGAVHDALKNALGLVVGVYVSQEALVSKAMLIEDNITSQTEGYIERYDVLKQWREGGFARATVKTLVRKEDLSQKIQSLKLEPGRLGDPAVIVDVTEMIDGKPSPSRYAEQEIKRSLVAGGFVVAEAPPADIAVTGTAESSFNTDQGLGGLVSYRATLSLTARMAQSGDVIAAAGETVGGVDATREAAARTALTVGARKAGGTMPAAMLEYLRSRSSVRLTVTAVPGMNELNAFTRALRALIAVRDCRVRAYDQGTAALDVVMKAGAGPELAKGLEQLSSQKLIVQKASAYAVEAVLERRPE